MHGPSRPPAAGVVVLCMVRDGEEYLEEFLDHYFSLGARHVVLLDNGSSDATVSLAKKRRGVTILSSTARVDRNEVVLRRYLARRFAARRWCLCVDIDEFFDYPFSSSARLDDLTAYLDEHGFTAVVTQMLDMLPAKPLSSLRAAGGFRRSDYGYYDLSAVDRRDYFSGAFGRAMKGNVLADASIKFHTGGARKALFGTDNWLTKHQLILPAALELSDAHCVSGARCADFTAACLHYKLTPSLFERTRRYVERGFGAALDEYRAILETPEDPRPRLGLTKARKLRGLEQLIEEGFLSVSPRYRRWVNARRA